jgi:hypothetical protein
MGAPGGFVMLASFVFTTLLLIHPAIPVAAQDGGQTAPAQSSPPPSSQSPSAQSSPGKNPGPVKIWTNDDLPTAGEPALRAKAPKKNSRAGPDAGQAADPKYAAGIKKQLDTLQAQLEDTDKQLAGLKSFRDGENVTTPGVELRKGINRTPVDQQITALEIKKKQLQEKISDLLDEARKKGVEPGQLR